MMKLAILLSLALFLLSIEGLIEFNNIKCKTIDKSFVDFDYCHIRAVNRTYKYVSVKGRLFQVPVTNVTVSIDVRKKANGYKPFLYNVSFDACKFMRSKNNPLLNYFYKFIEPYTNMNHTCPYDHDLILEKMDVSFVNNRVTKLLPVPEGEYAVFTTWAAYNIPRGHIDIFAKLS